MFLVKEFEREIFQKLQASCEIPSIKNKDDIFDSVLFIDHEWQNDSYVHYIFNLGTAILRR